MTFRRASAPVIIVLLAAGLIFTPATVSAQSAGEAPPVFQASQLLPGQPLAGPNYRINESVRNDGFINHYTVNVDGKSYAIASNALMKVRLGELAALNQMEAIKGTSVYKSAVKQSVSGMGNVAKGMVTKPVDTVKGVASGFGSFFKGIGHSMFGGASEQEEGVLKTAVGFDAAKRKFAARFGIDPYTSFPPVRERLDDIAWAGVGGSLTVSGAFQAIPGGVGTAARGIKMSGGMMKLVHDTNPAELKKINVRKLRAMKVSDTVIDLFLTHPRFSPTQKTILVSSLAQIGAYNRQAFIQRAVLVQSEEMAFFMRRWARMFAHYHIYVKPIRRFVRLGQMPLAQREDGMLIAALPIDHLALTDAIAGRHATNMKDIPNIEGVTGGEIWIEGTISPKARAELESERWVVNENVGAILKMN